MPRIFGTCSENVLASRKLVCGEARRLADFALVEAEQAAEGQEHFLSTLALASTVVGECSAAIANINKVICDLSATTHASLTKALSSEQENTIRRADHLRAITGRLKDIGTLTSSPLLFGRSPLLSS